MWRMATRAFSPGGRRGRLVVLYFHRVYPEQDELSPDEPTAAGFRDMLGWLQSQFRLLPLDEAVRRLREGTLPPRAAAITFDDGYRDNHDVAAPILLQRGVPATFFVATSFLDGGIMFNDIVIECIRRCRADRLDVPELGLPALDLRGLPARRASGARLLQALKYQSYDERAGLATLLPQRAEVELPRDLMMTSEQVRRLSEMGFGVGAHTHTHPILARMDDAGANADIRLGRSALQRIVGRHIGLFAYPNGRRSQDYDARHRDMVRDAGFDAAFSTERGSCDAQTDPWQLPRFTPWDRTAGRFKMRLLLAHLHGAAG